MIARYVNSGSFNEEFLLCSPLELATMASGNLEKASSFENLNIFVG